MYTTMSMHTYVCVYISFREYKYKKTEFKDDENKYAKLIKSIEANGIGVNKIIETPKAIGLELTQFTHPNLDIVESQLNGFIT